MAETLHIYTRVSTTSQADDGTSLETQTESGIKRASILGMQYKIWNEGSRSSSTDNLSNRPVLNNLLDNIRKNEIKHLYVWNTDRLSRNSQTWNIIRITLIQNNVILYTIGGEYSLSDPTTNLLIGVLSEFSQYDNQLRTERLRAGKFSRVQEGYWHGGAPPYGYRLENHKLVPEETEVKWVKFIFEKYKSGLTIDEIRTELLTNGVLTRRGKAVWSHGSISALLTNTHYSGYYYFFDKKIQEQVRIECDPILSPSLIRDVLKVKESRSYNQTNNKRVKTSNQKHLYLLSGLLECGHCGGKYGGHYKEKQNSYYSCNKKDNKYKTKHTEKYIKCTSIRNLRLDTTDDLVWNTVLNVVSKSYGFKEDVKKDLLDKESLREQQNRIRKINKEVKKLESDISKVRNALINLNTTKLIGLDKIQDLDSVIFQMETRKLEFEEKKEKLLNELIEYKNQKKWIDWVKEFGNRIEQLKNPSFSIEDKKNFLNGIIEKIIVFSDNIREHELIIHFRLPYVDDELIYKDISKKSLGYTIQKGNKTKNIRVNSLKK